MTLPTDFDDFFRLATGRTPYAYQRSLAQSGPPPSVLDAPTGSGKTQALLLSWLYARRIRGEGPRRLVYALPMRSLVEQTATVAETARQALGLSSEDLPVHLMMGGEPRTDWREHPEREQILVGTIDMLLSRALNRGYGESRFEWPISFGLLNSDCRWVFDEMQLMGPARATSAQLDGLRAKLETALPCETIWASATVGAKALQTVDRLDLGTVLSVPEADRQGFLAARLEATKTVARVDLTGSSQSRQPRTMAEALVEAHVPGTRSIAVVNTVERAQALADALRRLASGVETPPAVVLLHSRFRPADRAARTAEALAEPSAEGPGLVVVATQVIEAGVDVSSRMLATETAPFSSIVQRAGRLNRAGEHEEASLLWFDSGEPVARSAAPYEIEDLRAARETLKGLVGTSASPKALGTIAMAEKSDDSAILRRRDLVDLFDTGPDLSGMDVDVSAFIREDEERTASVFFRALEGSATPIAEQARPERQELVSAPLAHIRNGRRAWAHDHLDGIWLTAARERLRPGVEIMLDAADGGYDEYCGWDPALTATVETVERDGGSSPEGVTDDPWSMGREWMSLSEHLARAERAAAELTATLRLEEQLASGVTCAASLHDVGKAHSVFQGTLLSAAGEDERERLSGQLWAKSAHRGGRHPRRGFRHELASALAVRSQRDQSTDGGTDPRLVAYLVGAHHGRVRMGIRPLPGEQRPPGVPEGSRFALGVAEGDELPLVSTPVGDLGPVLIDLECMELGGTSESWTDAACALRDALGPFRLAFLEALVRVADWRASG